MDYIDTLLIIEDHLDENEEDLTASFYDHQQSGMTTMINLSKSHAGNPLMNSQITLHQIGVFAAGVHQCHRKSKISAAN